MAPNEDLLSLPDGFDSPSGRGGGVTWFKMKNSDDELVLRVLPSMKGLVSKRQYAVYRKMHFGWLGKHPTDPTKTIYRPWNCVEEKRNKMITKECSGCALRLEWQKKLDALRADEDREMETVKRVAKEKGVAEARLSAKLNEIVEKYKPLKAPIIEWLSAHSINGKYLVYVMNKQGQMGIFQLNYTMKTALDKVVRDLENENYPKKYAGDRKVGIKFNGRVGVWLKFTRVGKASPQSDTVSVNMVPVGDEGARVMDFHVISDEQLKQAQEVLPCLFDIVSETRITSEQVNELIAHTISCNGASDPDVVDRILGPRGGVSKPAPKVQDTEDPFADGVLGETKAETAKSEPSGTETNTDTDTKASTQNAVEGSSMSDDEFGDIF